jgi:cell division protein FtsX
MNIRAKFNYYIAAITSVFLLALALNTLYQARDYYQKTASRIQLAVFLKNNSAVSLDVTQERLLNMDGVRNMQYFSADKALEKALKETPAIKDVIISGDNPFPAYFVITPRSYSPAAVEDLKDRISLLDGVDETRYDSNLVNISYKLKRFISFYLEAGKILLLFIVLVIAAKFGWLLYTKELNYSKYIFSAVTGLLAGVAASALYFFLVGKILPAPLEPLPLKTLFYLIPSGMLFTLIWDN